MTARKPQSSLQTLQRASSLLVNALELRHCKREHILSAMVFLCSSSPGIVVWLRDLLNECMPPDTSPSAVVLSGSTHYEPSCDVSGVPIERGDG